MPEILCAGELLFDLISTDYADSFAEATTYQRLPGGSPANLAGNLARLGRDVGLIATVGGADAGGQLVEAARTAGVDVSRVRHTTEYPSTLILVTKSRATSNFEAYRAADAQILLEQFSPVGLTDLRVLHTTAFALSRNPARTSILTAAKSFSNNLGFQLSIDANYAAKIWPDRAEARTVISDYLSTCDRALAKFSDVDYERLFGEPVDTPARAVRRIRELGAYVVCLTLGGEGCYVLAEDTEFHLPVRPVTVRDTTGAGDAFWSGFLAAYLAGYGWEACARAGRGMAERKLEVVGALLEVPPLASLVADDY